MEVSIRSNLKEYLNHHSLADQLFTELYNIGDLYLIGGVLREFLKTGDFRMKSGNPRPFNDRDESVKSYI